MSQSTIPVFHLVSGGIGGAERVFVYTLRAVAELGYRALGVLVIGNERDVKGLIHEAEVNSETLKKILLKTIFKKYPLRRAYRLQGYLSSLAARYAWKQGLGERPPVCINTKTEEAPFTNCGYAKTIYYVHNPFFVTGTECSRHGAENLPKRLRHSLSTALTNTVGRYLEHKHRQGDIVVVNSDFSAQLVAKHLGFKPRVIYPPVDVSFFEKCSLEKKEDTIICVGRITKVKRHDLCIRVLKQLPEHVKLVIAGNTTIDSPSYIRYLLNLAADLGVRERISIEPSLTRKDLRKLFCRAKVLLHPMRGEHFGIVVVEAMAAGVVPVVWDYGGPAFVVPRRFQFSSIEEIPEKVMDALKVSSALRKSLRKIAQRYDTTVFISNIRKLIAKNI